MRIIYTTFMSKSIKRSQKKSKNIYLDYASSVEPNPSSVHSLGIQARSKLENARKEIAGVLFAPTDEIIFTSGGTESNNLAIQGVVFAWHEQNKGNILPHIITTNIEHASVLETFKLLSERKLAEISIVAVEENGIVDPKRIKKEIKKNTILVSVMYANNEIGTVQSIREIAKEIRHWKKGKGSLLEQGYFSTEKFLVLAPTRSQVSKKPPLPFFHTDAVQAANYLDLNMEKLGVDLLTLSGSKIEGAGRVGVLYKKKSVVLVNIFGGGDQEFGLRPGTENLPEILRFFSALKEAEAIKDKEVKRLTILRDYFFKKLSKMPFDIVTNGDLKYRLPNNINITIPKIPSDLLVIELSAKGIMASSKSACKSGDGKASHVIKAINSNVNEADGSLRFSLVRKTT